MRELEEKILHHITERGWDKLRPGDLAKSIMIEGAELLELFQWDNDSLEEVKENVEKMEDIRKELADVLIYALQMSILLELDTEQIVRDKLASAAEKYPAELMRESREKEGSHANSVYWAIKKAHREKKL